MSEEYPGVRQDPDSATNEDLADPKRPGSGNSDNPEDEKWFVTSELAKYGKTVHDVLQRLTRAQALEDQNRMLEEKLGQQGDELGQIRQQNMSTEQVKAVREEFYSRMTNADTAWDTFTGMITAAIESQENSERQRRDAYEKVAFHDPTIREIGYDAIIHRASLDNVPFRNLTQARTLKKIADGIKQSNALAIDPKKVADDAYRRGIEDARKAMIAKGIIPPTKGGASPQPADDDKPDDNGEKARSEYAEMWRLTHH